MKTFVVTDTNNPEFKLKEFKINTQIRNHVKLPFTNDEYRCVMFDGIFVRLVYEDDYIVGVNV